MNHLHVVILAGGSGTRLWPLSTPGFPKQFLPLPNGKSMIQETLARVASLVTPAQTWVVTGRSMRELVREHLPMLPPDHLLGEPIGRNSAPAIAWIAATIARRDPAGVMIILSADHMITQVETFRQALQLACHVAEQGHLVTLGIKPTTPATGYGYIRYAAQLAEDFEHQAFSGERFVEKPDLATAQSYLDDGHYVWNSGMFIWQVETILREMRTHLPEVITKIDQIVTATGTPGELTTLNEIWPTIQSISIDYGIMEKVSHFTVIPTDIGWNDVGNWEQYGALFPANEQGVRRLGPHEDLESQNIFVYNTTSRQVFTIGLEDVVVVEMEDKTLICHLSAVQRVKEIAEKQNKQA
ncbi:MAG TPA: mannose-1-phosphate guanylyltransferase [Ktedonobacteraceae bacterium]|nr:mannose-1-phosphate guanylyltransferase [Ktedonobacteraceae bacterium]